MNAEATVSGTPLTGDGQRSLSRRDVFIGGSIVAAAGLAWAGSSFNAPRRLPGGDLGRLIPKTIGGWRAAEATGVILPEEGDLSKSTYDEVLARVYLKDDSPPVMLLIAYGGNQSGNMQLHRPEACYPAAGFSLSDVRNVNIEVGGGKSIPARAMQAAAAERQEHVVYWTRIGNEFPLSPSKQRWAVVRSNLKGRVPDGVLVRISVLGDNPAETLAPLQQFVLSLTSTASPVVRALLVGSV
jgi:EpsI family protein